MRRRADAGKGSAGEAAPGLPQRGRNPDGAGRERIVEATVRQSEGRSGGTNRRTHKTIGTRGGAGRGKKGAGIEVDRDDRAARHESGGKSAGAAKGVG